MNEIITAISAVSFRVMSLISFIPIIVWVTIFIANRFCSDGLRNPNNPNRPLEYYSKKELIRLIEKERKESLKKTKFFDNLSISDFANKWKAFQFLSIKSNENLK